MPLSSVSFVLPDADATFAWGHRLGRLLGPGQLVSLSGELGAGKTTMCRGIAAGMGMVDLTQVTSPTYALMHEYGAARGTIVHIDAYRLAEKTMAIELGLEEAWLRKDALVLIEWAERLEGLLPPADVRVQLCVGAEGRVDGRTLVIEAAASICGRLQPA